MSILCDKEIRNLAQNQNMISPFEDKLCSTDAEGNRIVSYGLSSFGYDTRLANEFKVFTNANNTTIDPKKFDPKIFVDQTGDTCIIPPNSFVLGRTVEKFSIPEDCLVVCVGKSTYARCGVIVNVTPLEPGWSGYVTLEFSNTTQIPVILYANEGACQFLFFQGNQKCEVSYATRSGKYQNQNGITLPKV